MKHRPRSTQLRPLALGLLWISPWLVGTLVFLAIPAAVSMYLSFTDYSLLRSPVFVGLDNYRELSGDGTLWTAVGNTAVFAVSSVVLSTVLSVVLAALLEQSFRGAALVAGDRLSPDTRARRRDLCVLAVDVQHQVRPRQLRSRALVGIPGPDWLGDRSLALGSLIFASLWVVGSAVMVCSAGLKSNT